MAKTSDVKTSQHRTVTIIGAGPAGSSCAIVLRRKGVRKVVLIDAPKKDRFQIGESIPPDMNRVLRELGVRPNFVQQGHDPCYGSCSYWGSELRGYNDTILSPHGHGWHLNRARFNTFMQEEALSLGADLLNRVTFESAEKHKDGFTLSLKNEEGRRQQLETDLVVDASGSRAVFARSQGSVKLHDRPLICLGLRFGGKHTAGLSALTHLESVEEGWWYAARIPGGQVLVTLYSNAATVKQLELQQLQRWIQRLQAAPQTSRWVQRLEPLDEQLMAFPAPSFQLDKVNGARWTAIGDAATTFDPITSNGIIKAVTHGMQAAELILAHLNGQADALAHFNAVVKQQHAHYLAMRRHYYGLEQRWPDSPFWREMHETVPDQATGHTT